MDSFRYAIERNVHVNVNNRLSFQRCPTNCFYAIIVGDSLLCKRLCNGPCFRITIPGTSPI